jgi:hypothetical protein
LSQLGKHCFQIELGGEAYTLRPTLLASTQVIRQHGLASLLTAVRDFNVNVIGDLLVSAGVRRAMWIKELALSGPQKVRETLTPILTEFVLALAGIDPKAPRTEAQQPSPVNPDEVFTSLFKLGTGWLGWSPETTWNATPDEILAARSGRTDMIVEVMKAVFGSSEDNSQDSRGKSAIGYTETELQQIVEQGRDPAYDRNAAVAFKIKLQA